MQGRILTDKLIPLEFIDLYKSFLWVDRYDECGDFEIITDPRDPIVPLLKKDYYIELDGSDHLMVIESFDTETDFEEGDHVFITGRSLESILDRRIVWKQTQLNGNFQNQIEKLFNDAIINPEIASRKIDNFVYRKSTDPYITGLTVKAQFTGDNLYEVICKLCKEKKLGFKILLEDGKFVFQFYYGRDLSYDQTSNPVVVFSPGFENLANSKYKEDNKPLKTVALVAGEGEGADRKTTAVESSSQSGLLRREMFVDAREISSTTSEGTEISSEQYYAALKKKGTEELAANFSVRTFEGEMVTTSSFELNRDFFLGDVVHVLNQYGQEAKSRVAEVIFHQDMDKKTVAPKFSSAELNLNFAASENHQDSSGRPTMSQQMEEAQKAIKRMDENVTQVLQDLATMVKSVDVMYYLSDSGTQLTGGEWKTNPSYSDGKYLWSKTISIMGNGTRIETNPVCIYSPTAGGGGSEIESISEWWYPSTEENTLAGGIWHKGNQEDALDLLNGDTYKSIWTKTSIKFKDGTPNVETTPTKANGLSGAAKAQSAAIMASSAKSAVIELENRANSGEFNGAPGADGRTPIVHIAYMTATEFTKTWKEGVYAMGIYTDYNAVGSDDPQVYSWSHIKGDTGPLATVVISVQQANPMVLEATLYVNGKAYTDGSITYKWYRNNMPLSDGTSKTITANDPTGNYRCKCKW